jgi:hypothetical protein
LPFERRFFGRHLVFGRRWKVETPEGQFAMVQLAVLLNVALLLRNPLRQFLPSLLALGLVGVEELDKPPAGPGVRVSD